MKRVMCVYLPAWPLQRLGHEQPALRQQAVVIVDAAARGPRVVLASRRAAQAGVRPGMPLAEARSLVPQVVVHDYDAEADRRGLLELAKAADRYSPVVATEEVVNPRPQGEFSNPVGTDPPEGLLIDVAGCAGCFGGEDQLLERAARDYADEGWMVRLALADTVGAAWGLSRYGPSPCLVPPGETRDRVGPLPLAALRLPLETLTLLRQLGLERVDDVLRLPRADLAARFGPLLLLRLDQALGQAAEVVVRPGTDPELQTAHTLDFPIERFADLLYVIDHLLEDLQRVLSRRDLGARQLECRLYHEDAPPTVVEVGLYRPSRCPRYLGSLLRSRLEQIELGGLVSAVCLTVPVAERIAEVQRALFFERGAEDEGLAALIDRLSNLLGRQAVARPACVADAQPEYAFRFEPVLRRPLFSGGSQNRRPRRAALRAAAKRKQEIAPPPPLLPRPLTVWPAPAPVEVLALFPDGPPARFTWQGTEWRVVACAGPERIETGWWRDADVERDYYVVTTQAGSRYWLFRRRDDGRWFLHGCFD
jgi:protein ImuB